MSNSRTTNIIVDGFSKIAIAQAVAVLRRGGLVGIPTETVYGLAADVENDDALRRVFVVKRRPLTHPLIVHIDDAARLDAWSRDISPMARELGRVLWPGPLTMLLRRSDRVSLVATGGRDTVAIRVPAHPVALELLREFDGALAAPSANRFGRVSPTTAQHVLADLGDDADLILDGGPCRIGVESTIVDMTGSIPQLLRPGSIPSERIEEILNIKLESPDGQLRAPGMLESHYAPDCVVELVESSQAAQIRSRQLQNSSLHVKILDYSHDLDAYAKNLYGFLRSADRAGCDVVVAVMPPARGLGIAIRDRLSKASK
jgi:L-threonylcarbamoyladenylate synthase